MSAKIESNYCVFTLTLTLSFVTQNKTTLSLYESSLFGLAMASVLLVFRLIVINTVIKILQKKYDTNELSDFTG